MNCKTVIKNLDDYLDGELEAAVQDSLLAHLKVCPDCKDLVSRERYILKTLKELPAPAPDAVFVDQVFSRAISKAKRSPRRYASWIRLAAGIVIVVALGFSYKANWRSSRIDASQVNVVMNVQEEIRLVFHSKEALDSVTFSIKTPENIELAGYGDKRELIWQGGLSKGSNLLVLPVIARDSSGGLIIANIRHGQKMRQFNVQLTVEKSSDSGASSDRKNIYRMSVIPI